MLLCLQQNSILCYRNKSLFSGDLKSIFLDNEIKPDKKWGKAFKILSAEIEAQFQLSLLSNMHAVKQHPVYTSHVFEKMFTATIRSRPKILVTIKGLSYCILSKRELIICILQVRYVECKINFS